VHAAVGGTGQHDGGDHRDDDAGQHDAASALAVQVDHRQRRSRLVPCRRARIGAPPQQHPDRDHQQADQEQRRQQHVGQDPQVGAALEAGQLDGDQHHHQHQRHGGDQRAEQA